MKLQRFMGVMVAIAVAWTMPVPLAKAEGTGALQVLEPVVKATPSPDTGESPMSTASPVIATATPAALDIGQVLVQVVDTPSPSPIPTNTAATATPVAIATGQPSTTPAATPDAAADSNATTLVMEILELGQEVVPQETTTPETTDALAFDATSILTENVEYAAMAILIPTLDAVPSSIVFSTGNAMPAVDTTYTAQSVSGKLTLSFPALLSLSSLSVNVSLSVFTIGGRQALDGAVLSFGIPAVSNSSGLVAISASNVNAVSLSAGGSSSTLLSVLNISLLSLGSSNLTWTADQIKLKVLGGSAMTGTASATLNWTISAI